MISYLKENFQFLLLLLLWFFIGKYGGNWYYVIIPVSFVLLKYKGMYAELLIGVFYILILSDSFFLPFAKSIKPIIILLLTFFLFFDRKSFTPFHKLFLFFLPFFLFTPFTLIQSDTLFISIQKNLSYILLFLIVPNYISKSYNEEGEKVFRKIIFFGILILIICVLFIFIDKDIAYLSSRYRGIFGNPNGLGMFCALFFMLFSVINFHYDTLFSKYETIIIYSVILLSILYCASRNTIFALFIFLLFIKINKASPFFSFIILFGIIISYELILIDFLKILHVLSLDEYFRGVSLDTGSGRIVAWKFAWENIKNNIFMGKGFFFEEYLFLKHENQMKLQLLGHIGGAHNSFLAFWLNTGIFGLVLFLSGFFLMFYRLAKKSVLALPLMYAVIFLANFEPWLAASLNPYTIQLLITLTIIYNLTSKLKDGYTKKQQLYAF